MLTSSRVVGSIEMLNGVRRAVVLGIGSVTGEAVCKVLIEAGVEVRVSERAETPEHLVVARRLSSKGAQVEFGPPSPSLLLGTDVVIPAPAVPPANQLLRQASKAGIKIWSEIELGYRMAKGPIIAITGTNGKTTVTSLLASVCEAAGLQSLATGNIGLPLVEAVRTAPATTTFICEVSSFQLHFIDRFHPRVAIVLNVAHDHYDWHSGYDDYLASKARITENQVAEDVLIVNGDDHGCLSIAQHSKAQISKFFAADDPVSDIRLKGPHNIENVAAVVLAARALGLDMAPVIKAIRAFEPLPHRATSIGVRNGVHYIDDSKATNPHATLSALREFDSVILIAGGQNRGLDLSALRAARAKVKVLVAMGEVASSLESVFHGIPCYRAADVEQAVGLAASSAEPGDIVLLSPACSSWDQYSSYAERGDRFAKAVRSL